MTKEEIKQCAVNYVTEQLGADGIIDPKTGVKLSDMLAGFHSQVEEYKEKRSTMTDPVPVLINHSVYSLELGKNIYRCPTCHSYSLQPPQQVCECGQTLEWSDDVTRP